MELQKIHLSIFYILLPDFLLHLLGMIGDMSRPINGYHRCAPARHTKTTSLHEPEKSRILENNTEDSVSVLLDTLQPRPLTGTMYSLQFVALHPCASQKPANTSMADVQFHSSNGPSCCYFFIDMQPQNGNKFNYTGYDFNSCDDDNYGSISDNSLGTNPLTVESSLETLKLQRQRSISECTDDSFICFEDDNSSVESVAFGDDSNTSENVAECNSNDREFKKKVRFNLKPKVHIMHAWDFAYRAARKGDWQKIACDHDRFQKRIDLVAPIINTILSSNHRETVYKDRFSDVKQ